MTDGVPCIPPVQPPLDPVTIYTNVHRMDRSTVRNRAW
jgi:hypothetical protein